MASRQRRTLLHATRCRSRLRADRPARSVSPAVGPCGIPRDHRIRTVRRRSSLIGIDQRQATEGTLDEQLVRVLGGDEERALARTTHDGLLVHVRPSAIARARPESVARGYDTPTPHPPPQRRPIDPQSRRREAPVPAARLDRALQPPLLVRGRDRGARPLRVLRSVRLFPDLSAGGGPRLDRAAPRADDSMFDAILQLPHVAGPVVILENGHGARRDGERLGFPVGGQALQEELRQRRDVGPAPAQRRVSQASLRKIWPQDRPTAERPCRRPGGSGRVR